MNYYLSLYFMEGSGVERKYIVGYFATAKLRESSRSVTRRLHHSKDLPCYHSTPYVSREGDEYLNHASREGGRPAQATLL
jgi:hypothetical protein